MGKVDELLALATDEVRQIADDDAEPAIPYRVTEAGILYLKHTQHGAVGVPLTNFTARIVADVAEDDGSGEVRRLFEMEAKLGDRVHQFSVLADKFDGMSWPIEYLGAEAVVYPGMGLRDHTRAAVQLLSPAIDQRRLYTYVGWRHLPDGLWVYLHAGGAIGPNGPVAGVEVGLPSALTRYHLPAPPEGDELVHAVRASLALLEVARDAVTMPGFAAVPRATLGAVDLSIAYVGPTGAGKTALAALQQQHYGAELDARHLPANWSSTDNALEGVAFAAKDALLVIDDFNPTGSPIDVQRWHQKGDRVLRAQGNRSGRQRMRADGTLRPERPPRGLIVSTGEDVPRGQSLGARMAVVEVGPKDIDFERLFTCQQDAAAGLYAQCLSAFVRWLARRYEAVQSAVRPMVVALRQLAVTSATHRRTPEIVANLAVGFGTFLAFAVEARAITLSEAEELWRRCWLALGETAAAQSQHQAAAEPTLRYLSLVAASIDSGQAFLRPTRLERDPVAAPDPTTVTTGDINERGTKIGWFDGDDIFLISEAAFATAQKLGASQGESLTVRQQTLHKRLDERGLLASTERGRGHLTIRKMIGGRRHTVLHLKKDALWSGATAQSAQPSHSADRPVVPLWRPTPDGPFPWAVSDNEQPQTAQEIGPATPDDQGGNASAGPNGTDGPSAEPDGEVRGRHPVTVVLTNDTELAEALPSLLAADVLGLDVETAIAEGTIFDPKRNTSALDPRQGRLRLIQLAIPNQVFVIDVFKVGDLTPLVSLFTGETEIVAHNAAFDLAWLLAAGLPLPQRIIDTLLLAKIVEAGRFEDNDQPFRLEALAKRHLDATLDKAAQKSDWSTIDLSPEQLAYAARDATVLLPLHAALQTAIQENKLTAVARLELALLPFMAQLKANGMPFDAQRWEELGAAAAAQRAILDRECYALFGKEFNLRSPVQRAAAFAEVGVKLPLTEKGEPSSSKKALQPLATKHPVVPKYLAWNKLDTLVKTFGSDAWRPSSDGRLHASFRQIGTQTGRTSCAGPNLQQVPKESTYRACFKAPPGRVLVRADLAMVQVCCAAELSGDEKLIQALNDGRDVHALTAATLYCRPVETIGHDSPERKLGKTIVFGTLFGQGVGGLLVQAALQGLTLTEPEARAFLTRFDAAWPQLAAWRSAQMQRTDLEIRSPLGRVRYVSPNVSGTIRVNTPIQMLEADGVKSGMIRLWAARTECPSAVPVNFVHDELLYEVDEAEAPRLEALIRRCLQEGMAEVLTRVAVRVDVQTSTTWAGEAS